MKPRVCFVVQRYGLEVNGGAELQSRQMAEHLLPYCDVDVLTSKAIDYMTWKDEYTNETEIINGVHIRRFSVGHPRDISEFNIINQRFMDSIHTTPEQEQEWVDAQGPYLPNLIEYIRKHKNDYDAFVFFTYLYYQTVMGVQEVKDKAIVIPEAHDEPFMRMRIFENVFRFPKAFFFNTAEERQLVHRKYYNHFVRDELGGVGIEMPEKVCAKDFIQKYGIDNYIIYVGRIDEGKNCRQLFDDFIAYKKKHPSDLKLVLMGKEVIPVPECDDIVSLGFVSDQDKFDGIAGAKLLVLPSKFESLSMVVLEAFSLDVPVLVNGVCEVLKAHCQKSNGGFYYETSEEFEAMLDYMIKHEDIRKIMGQHGHRYADENYQWDVVIRRLYTLIQYVMDENKKECQERSR